MFIRSLFPLISVELMPGRHDFTWLDLGGHQTASYLFVYIAVLNSSEVETYDFETDEVTGVGVINYNLFNGPCRTDQINYVEKCTPLLVMTDITTPKEYIYADLAGGELQEELEQSKSSRNDYYNDGQAHLPVLKVTELGGIIELANFAGVARYAIKPNHQFFASSILCSSISVYIRRRIKSGVQLEAYSFL